MRSLMRHDIVREAGEHRFVPFVLEVPEKEPSVTLRVEGVRLSEGMRRHVDLMSIEAPRHPAPKRELKARKGSHDDRVGILGMKSRITDEIAGLPANRNHRRGIERP